MAAAVCGTTSAYAPAPPTAIAIIAAVANSWLPPSITASARNRRPIRIIDTGATESASSTGRSAKTSMSPMTVPLGKFG